MPEAEPEPPGTAAEKGDVLPEWLSDVAKDSNFEVTLDDDPAPADSSSPKINSSDDLTPLLEELEIKLMDDEEPAEPPPARPSVKSAIDLPRKGRGDQSPPRDLRLGLLVAAVIVLIAVAALVWSVLTGRKADTAPEENIVVAEETLPAEESVEEPAESEAAPDAVPQGKALFLEEPPDDTPVPAPVPDQPANRIIDVVAAARGDGTTVVVRGNGYFDEANVRISLLKNPGRVWLRIRRIETYYRPNEIEVGSPQVSRIRVGHHPEENPPSLYVVLDLADDSAAVLDQEVDGNSIRVRVGRR